MNLGEFALIDWIRGGRRSAAGPWTSWASATTARSCILRPGADLLVTTDMLMDGRHSGSAEDGPEAVGYKALGVNLSDIAAMAGVPLAAVVAVALPRARRPSGARAPRRHDCRWPTGSASTWSAATPTPGTARW